MKTNKCPYCDGTGRVIDNKVMGQEMRALRQRKGVSGRTLATAMGISAAYLSDLELGRRNWHSNIISHYKATLEDL
jgi:transcriptional regulator with XRE-family HTH domain